MDNRRKICVVTGTRAEYGLLYWLMREIQEDPDLELQVIATGMHLSPDFGLTFRAIEADGFSLSARVEMLLSSDTPVGITKSIGLGVISFADALERLRPDILVVLGDRYEILAAAQAALIAKIPVAHLHGGELTEGAMDEAIRHSITKMAHLHFVSTASYRRRVIQLGENPARVFNFGAPAVDNIMKLPLLSRAELEKSIDFRLGELTFLVTYHPVTLAEQGPEEAMNQLLKALDKFPTAKVIFTRPNSDTYGRIINEMLDGYVAKNFNRAAVYTSLGQLRYLSAVKHADVVIGNSSSGLIEVPVLKTPTVNIGERQQGRLRPASVIDCKEDEKHIVAAIQKALTKEFEDIVSQISSPFGDGNASLRIKECLKKTDLNGIIQKKFFDLGGDLYDHNV